MPEEPEEEKTYEVKDKRRVSPDGELRETEEPEPAPEESAAPQEPADQEPLPQPSVYDLLQFVAGMIAEQAWLQMGLRLAPGQKEPTKDLAQAKLAIDTFAFIAEQMEPHLEDADRKALRSLVSDLKVNFVRQSQ